MSMVKVIQYPSESLPKKAISRNEVMRYMGCKEASAEIESLIDQGIFECADKLTYKVAYREFPIFSSEDYLDLGFVKTKSRDLRSMLNRCDSVILFAATVGIGIDRAILKHGRLSPSIALAIQAIGSERIEALCNTFCFEMKEKCALEGRILTPRFSPGYGDLPLELQKDIFLSLGCEKNIGLTLNDSLLMSPTKSVTAIIGIKTEETNENT